MTQDMNDIFQMVRGGRLRDATSAIQDWLQGADGGAAKSADDGPGPMKNVTPKMRRLEPPQPAGDAKPRPTGPARKTGKSPGAWQWLQRGGDIPYRVYVPANPVADAPVIVMLHGCTQTSEDFARGTGMNAAVERIGAHVVCPEQGRSANMNGCWNWFEPAHQGRGGEAAGIAAIALSVAREFAPEARGIHVAGL